MSLKLQGNLKPNLETMPVFSLLRELFKYQGTVTATPNDLLTEIVKRVSPAYCMQGIECIRGEGAIIKALDPLKTEIALKVLRPNLNISALPPAKPENMQKDEFIKISTAVRNFKYRFESGVARQKQIKQFIREAHVGHFDVPEVVRYQDKPFMCLEMEWIQGVQLIRWLRENNDIKYSLDKYFDVLDFAAFIHGHKIIHRDFKAENLMVTGRTRSSEKIVVVDFTTSKLLETQGVTMVGEGLGTSGYSDYDQLEGGNAKGADEKSDIHSLGIVLWEVLNHRTVPLMSPEDAANKEFFEGYHNVLEESIPASVRKIFRRATCFDRNFRYSSVGEFKTALTTAVSSLLNEQYRPIEGDIEGRLKNYITDKSRVETELGVSDEIVDTSFNVDDIDDLICNKEHTRIIKALMHVLIETGTKF